MLADTDQLSDRINEVVHPLDIVRSQLIAETTSDHPIKLGKEVYYCRHGRIFWEQPFQLLAA